MGAVLPLLQDVSEPGAVVGEDEAGDVEQEGEVEAEVVYEIKPAYLSVLQVKEGLGDWVLEERRLLASSDSDDICVKVYENLK